MLKQTDLKKGYKLAKRNFKVLFKTSKQAYINGDYGVACSLNILACEELMKSLAIFVQYYNSDFKIVGFDKMFYNHKEKHKQLIDFLKNSNESIKLLSFNVLEDKEQFLSLVPNEFYKDYVKEYKDVERVKGRVDKIKDFDISIDDIETWLLSANEFKNSGLYVNLNKDGVWSSPFDFEKKRYKEEKKYTKLLLLYYRNAIDIVEFNRDLAIRQKKYDNANL